MNQFLKIVIQNFTTVIEISHQIWKVLDFCIVCGEIIILKNRCYRRYRLCLGVGTPRIVDSGESAIPGFEFDSYR